MAKRRLSKDEWRRHIEGLPHSGLSRDEYCAQQGLHPKTMLWWERTLRAGGRQSKARSRKSSAFVEVTGALTAAADLRLELEVGGIKVRVPGSFEADALARVLSVLEARR